MARYRDIVLTVSDETQGFPTRLPKATYDRLRRAKFDHRVPMNVLVTEAVDRFLADEQAVSEFAASVQASRGRQT